MHLPIGTHLQGGRYEILRYINSGGFGCTYEARDTKFKSKEKTVAIKEFFVKDFCNRDRVTGNITVATESKIGLVEKMRKKFIEEAEALYDLQHANIVRVTDKFEENNTAYYVMDYIDGKPLSTLIDEKGRLGEKEALGYICQAASALEFVHKHNRLHLDVKPQNIMIDREGKAVLIDFGVSKQYDEVNGENTSTIIGYTPGFAPIEQSGNGITQFTPATDIYSLGATLYKALTGEIPVPAHLRASGRKMSPLPADISTATRIAVEKSMQLVLDNRPQSIAEFIAMLSKNGKGKTEDFTGEDTVDPESNIIDDADVEVVAPAPAIKSKSLLILALLLVLLLVGGVIFFVTGRGGGNDSETQLIVQQDTVQQDTVPENPEPLAVAEPVPTPVVNTDSIVAARLQAYQDSVSAVQVAEQAAREEQERIAREAEAQRQREEQERIARESEAQRQREEEERIAREAEAQRQREEAARIAREAEINAFKNRDFTVNGVSFKMVAVGGGTFQMGDTSEQQTTFYDEHPVHSVTLDNYYIGETEVTQELWQAVMGSNPSSFTGNSQHPVEKVSWNDCQTFVNKLNDLLAGQLPAGRRFRLPTEAEWEYAARGGNRSRGTQYSGSSSIDNVAWYGGNSSSTIHPVKGKSPNELGLYDMSGNVWEWCSDWYDNYTSSSQTNPEGPSSGYYRVLRGGSWYSGSLFCRVATRRKNSPGGRDRESGLRLAL